MYHFKARFYLLWKVVSHRQDQHPNSQKLLYCRQCLMRNVNQVTFMSNCEINSRWTTNVSTSQTGISLEQKKSSWWTNLTNCKKKEGWSKSYSLDKTNLSNNFCYRRSADSGLATVDCRRSGRWSLLWLKYKENATGVWMIDVATR